MTIAERLEQAQRGQGLGGSFFRPGFARFDLHRVTLKVHHLEIEISRNALIAPPVEQDDEAVAVFGGLPVSAPADRDAKRSLSHLRNEYVLHIGLVAGDLLDEEHPVRAARLAEDSRGNS